MFLNWSHQTSERVRSAVTQSLALCHRCSWQKHSTFYHWISLKKRIITGFGGRSFICSNQPVLSIHVGIVLATCGCAWLLLHVTLPVEGVHPGLPGVRELCLKAWKIFCLHFFRTLKRVMSRSFNGIWTRLFSLCLREYCKNIFPSPFLMCMNLCFYC